MGDEEEERDYNKQVADNKKAKSDYAFAFRGTPFEHFFTSPNPAPAGMPLKKQDPVAELMAKAALYQKNKPAAEIRYELHPAPQSTNNPSSDKREPTMWFENGDYAAEELRKRENKTDLSAKDAAEMAKRSYIDYDLDKVSPEEIKLGDGWVLIDKHKGKEGLVMHIYARGHGPESSYKGPKEYVIVNKGTTMTNVGDWINNAQQPLGLSTDMHESIDYVKKFAQEAKRENCKVTFVGHSKGGAEAVANAIATNCDAMIFNPAELSVLNHRPDKLYTGNIHSYVVAGEPLNYLNKKLFKYGLPYNTDYLPPHSLNPIDNHSIDAVISGLDRQKFKKHESTKKWVDFLNERYN